MKKCRLLFVLMFLAVGAAGGMLAQTTPPQNAAPSAPTITKESSLVLVDTVVTDKKGNYVRDLTANDVRVWQDNKEQPIKSFSLEGSTSSAPDRKHYIVLFFDNSTMSVNDQAKARDAALKFLDANTGENRYIAIVDFGGTLRVSQNFTTDAERLKQNVRNLKFSAVAPNAATSAPAPVQPRIGGIPQVVNAEANFGVRTLLLAVRNMAKSVSSVPGRKTLVLFSSGFPMNPNDPNIQERESELTAAINACNRANVAVYPIDVRGLTTPVGYAPRLQLFTQPAAELVDATLHIDDDQSTHDAPARLLFVQQRGGTGGGGQRGGTGGGPGSGRTGGTGNTGGTRTGNVGSRGVGAGIPRMVPMNPLPVTPYSDSRQILPVVTDITNNQQVLYELAIGTGGFVIVNTNDLLSGIQKIAHEQSEYYVLGYAPPQSDEGSCHTLKVKVNRGGTVVRSRSGYCNVRPADLLAGQPIEKELENRVTGSAPGTVTASMRAPYFYTSANTARVNLAVEIPSEAVKFEKKNGKQHATVDVLGLAYKQDGTVAARFSDTVEFNFDDKNDVKHFQKKPYEYQNQFEIGSGHYVLKVAFSSGGDAFGKLEMPLAIDNYDAEHLNISAVALSKELRPLGQDSATLDAALLEDRTPLVAQGTQIIPSGTSSFKRDDPAVFYAEVYDPRLTSADPPKLGIQMLVIDLQSREKKVQTGGPLQSANPGSPVIPVGLKLPVDKLSPGKYELQVRAVDSSGGATPVRTADFQVE